MLVLTVAQTVDAASEEAQTLTSARFIQSESPTPPSEGAPVTLPDAWEVSRPKASGYGWYLLDWTIASTPTESVALYLTATPTRVEIFVNGAPIGSNGTLTGRRPSSWEQSRACVLPTGIVHSGVNRIAIRVYSGTAGSGGLGPVVAGTDIAIRHQAYVDLLRFVVGPAIISTTIAVLGLVSVMLWLRRRDAAYGLFGAAAILWGLHTGLPMLPAPFLPQPHWAIWWHAVYMAFVGLLCLFCLRFTDTGWPRYRRFVVGFTLLVAPVLYLAAAFDVLGPATVYVRAIAIGAVAVALTAVARYAIRLRNVESLLLLAAGAISTVFAVHDWLIAQDPLVIRPLWLVPYAALSFLMLVAWILVDRFVRALNESERLNARLEQRVAEKNAALTAQLAETYAARDVAVIANRAKSRFLAAASHDLRQPLHALGLFTDALAQRTHDPEEAALVQKIDTSVTSLEQLFSALLDISQLDAGVVEPRLESFPVNALLDRMANDFAPVALERGLKLAVVPTNEVVQSDPLLLERILRNLAANALRYTERGGVVIGCRRRRDCVGIEVWDSGPGIAPGEHEHIFEEFYQIGNPERDRSRGLGLGLAIVRRLADLLGHEVEIRSRVGRGSVFGIWAKRATAPLSANRLEPDAFIDTSFRQRRVVVVDDEAPIRDGMAALLKSWGCVAIVAADPEEAIGIARHHDSPDALLVDYRLRGQLDGVQAVARLREAFGREIPAILISGESSVEELARIKQSGLLLLHKPVMPAKLRSALAFVLAGETIQRN